MNKLSKGLLISTAVGLGCFALNAILCNIAMKKNDKEIDEFYDQESVKQIMQHAEEESEELMDDFANEANEYVAQMQKELDEMMADYFAKQEEHMKKFHKICTGED